MTARSPSDTHTLKLFSRRSHRCEFCGDHHYHGRGYLLDMHRARPTSAHEPRRYEQAQCPKEAHSAPVSQRQPEHLLVARVQSAPVGRCASILACCPVLADGAAVAIAETECRIITPWGGVREYLFILCIFIYLLCCSMCLFTYICNIIPDKKVDLSRKIFSWSTDSNNVFLFLNIKNLKVCINTPCMVIYHDYTLIRCY